MKFIDKRTSNTTPEHIQKHAQSIDAYRRHLQNVVGNKDTHSSEYSLFLPFDKTLLSKITSIAKTYDKPELAAIIVIGIGGSNLGTWAVFDAAIPVKRPILFADTVDPSVILPIITQMTEIYEDNKHVLLIVASKSGKTTETIANFGVLVEVLKKHDPVWNDHIIAITEENSPLWNYANKRDYRTLPIPKTVGGRYSIFSSEGLLPLALSGVNLLELTEGAQDAVTDGLSEDFSVNTSIHSAAIIFQNYLEGKTIHNTFLFGTNLFQFGQWYRQLIAESLGKNGKGITPITTTGSTDLHSIGQLYFDGPTDKFTTFVSIDKVLFDAEITKDEQLKDLVPNISGKNLWDVMRSIHAGVIKSYIDKPLAFVEIQLDYCDEYQIGYLLQMKMLEVMYLAQLLEVNAFDQPGVEDYKTATKQYLTNS